MTSVGANQTVEDTPAGIVLYEMITIAFREGLKLPAELTLLARSRAIYCFNFSGGSA